MTTEENEMLGLFVQEASEHLQTLETDLVALESNPRDSDLLNRLFRAIHSVKGTAGFFGLTAITDLAHVMESVMALIRDGRMDATVPIISLFLTGTDKLRSMVAAPDQAAAIDTLAERTALHALLRSDPPAASAEEPAPELPLYLSAFNIDPELVRDSLSHGQNLYVVQLRLHADIEAKGQSIFDYFHDVESLGTLIDSATDVTTSAGLSQEMPDELVCSLLFSTAMEPDLLLCAFNLPPEQLTQVPAALMRTWLKTQPTLQPASSVPAPAPAAAPTPAPILAAPPAADHALAAASTPPAEPASLAPVAATASRVKADETVRISVSLLDGLMNLAGEMVLGRNQLLRLAASSAREARGTTLGQDGLSGVVQDIDSITSELQRTIMRARLQPVGGLFGKFNRIIRDLGQKLGKDIRLETVGEDVELDRTLIEGLSDPLTHLVRNSADHGIEPPEVRVRAGKPASGLVRISAAHLAGRVQIEVRDDGRGLDADKLKAKAVEKGLLTSEQAARLGEQEAWQLIFAPGFSTAAVVSDVSGRGVGMDVVKTNIERLGGRVEIQSALGHGMGIIIRLPLTLAIIPALIVGCADRRFAVPQLNLEEIVRPGPDRPLEKFGGSCIIRLREELLPVINLSALLGLPDTLTASDPGFVLILTLDNRRFGLQVEQIADTEEIVVKPLGRHLQGTPLYSGATFLGQGEIALILDLAGIAAGRLPAESALTRKKTDTVAQTTSERVLLFSDDTPETFALHIANIGRIEKIRSSLIERIGGHDYLRQKDGPTLRLLRIQDHLPVTPAGPLAEEVHIIVPRLVHHPVALIATRILDATDLPDGALDTASLRAPGILGTASLDNRLTILLDLYGINRTAGIEIEAAHRPDLRTLRVLLAEDTAFFREAVRRGLHDLVHTLDIAEDGEAAWQLLQKGGYDLLITDLEMPRLNGFELTARIRADARFKTLPVMCLSARDTEEFHERARLAGINHYETKLDRDRLCKAINRLLLPRLSSN